MRPMTIEKKNCDLCSVVHQHQNSFPARALISRKYRNKIFVCLLLTYRLFELYELHAMMQTNKSQAFFFFLLLASPDVCAKI